MNANDRPMVQTTRKTLDIVDIIGSRESATLTELAEESGMAKSTVLRHLNTLEEYGYVERSQHEYRLGGEFVTRAGQLRTRQSGYLLAEEYIEDLVRETGERVLFNIEQEGYQVILFRRTGPEILRDRSKIGHNGLLHDTASGKAILATMDERRIATLLDRHGLAKTTENTINDREELFEELATIRERGFAVSIEEAAIGYNGIATAVQYNTGDLLGALGIAGPSHRLTEPKMKEELADLLTEKAKELEIQIHYKR